jgi:hypothetical protein
VTAAARHRKRWKDVEVNVALVLSGLFSDVGHKPVKRIPILGRTGPDLTYNDIQLIVDVKSRMEVPISSLAMKGKELRAGNMTGFQLQDLLNLSNLSPFTAKPSVLVATWLGHMHEWATKYTPTGITCVILHRPKMPIGESTVIIYSTERNTLCHRLASLSLEQTPLQARAEICVHN